MKKNILTICALLSLSSMSQSVFDSMKPKVSTKDTTQVSKKTTKTKVTTTKKRNKCNLIRRTDRLYSQIPLKCKTVYGDLNVIEFKPYRGSSVVTYDIMYYIPKKLRGKRNKNALVYLHGGGRSTSSRNKSRKVIAYSYFRDLKRLADLNNFVLIFPSASGINWGAQTSTFLRDLNPYIARKLGLNSNKMALAGHSMGAMGITRSLPWLADQYSLFASDAAGIEEKSLTSELLMTYFNVYYTHFQGRNDHVKGFLEKSLVLEEKVKKLEDKYQQTSGFRLVVSDKDHNPDLRALNVITKNDLNNVTRNLYRKTLTGVFLDEKDETKIKTDKWSNGYRYLLKPKNKYFWLKAMEFSIKNKVISFVALNNDNLIQIRMPEGVSKLRVYLSSKMADLDKDIKITINDKVHFHGKVDIKKKDREQLKDSNFDFETYVDITL